jgi:hypothetical protein
MTLCIALLIFQLITEAVWYSIDLTLLVSYALYKTKRQKRQNLSIGMCVTHMKRFRIRPLYLSNYVTKSDRKRGSGEFGS